MVAAGYMAFSFCFVAMVVIWRLAPLFVSREAFVITMRRSR